MSGVPDQPDDCRITVSFPDHDPLVFRTGRDTAQRYAPDIRAHCHNVHVLVEDGPLHGLQRLPCEIFWLRG